MLINISCFRIAGVQRNEMYIIAWNRCGVEGMYICGVSLNFFLDSCVDLNAYRPPWLQVKKSRVRRLWSLMWLSQISTTPKTASLWNNNMCLKPVSVEAKQGTSSDTIIMVHFWMAHCLILGNHTAEHTFPTFCFFVFLQLSIL